MTREGDDASWGDLADDEIWGPATRRYALFSHRPLLSTPLVEREGDTTIEVGKATREKMPFDVAEEICTFFHPPTSPAPPNRRTFDSEPDLDPVCPKVLISFHVPGLASFLSCRTLYSSMSVVNGSQSHSLHKMQITRLSIICLCCLIDSGEI